MLDSGRFLRRALYGTARGVSRSLAINFIGRRRQMKPLITSLVMALCAVSLPSAKAAEASSAAGSVGTNVNSSSDDQLRENQLEEHRSVVVDPSAEPACHILIFQVREGDRLVGKRLEKCS
jgi:hypothetical protein